MPLRISRFFLSLRTAGAFNITYLNQAMMISNQLRSKKRVRHTRWSFNTTTRWATENLFGGFIIIEVIDVQLIYGLFIAGP
jgi:hypothetical protein